ncbi:DUF5983 family protein [Roseomonas mucosa]
MTHVRRFLDLSTAHLSPRDRACLEASALSGEQGEVSCGAMPYGWFVYAYDERPDISDTLWALMVEARRQDCDYLLFDADAQALPDFPCFDWEEPSVPGSGTEAILASPVEPAGE